MRSLGDTYPRVAGHILTHAADANLARFFEDGPHDVDTRREGFAILTQTLNDECFRLLYDGQSGQHVEHRHGGNYGNYC